MSKFFYFLTITLLFASCQRKDTLPLNEPVGGDFVIDTHNGMFDTKSKRGKPIFIFFGFTQCPMVCPTTLANLRRMTKLIGEGEQPEILFISVDHLRDTKKVMQERFKDYPPSFHGATQSEATTKKIMQLFGATSRIIQGTDPTDIIIDHTSSIFLINRKGVWVDSLRYDSSPEEILQAFKTVDRKTPVYSEHRRNREVEVLGQNLQCDLARTSCSVNGVEVTLGPYPITSERNYTVTVRTKDDEMVPQAVDFEGVDNNMGYIRPELSRTQDDSFQGTFYVPVCELPEMNWRAKVLIQTKYGLKALIFSFKTVHNSQSIIPAN